MDRREFLAGSATAVAAGSLVPDALAARGRRPDPTARAADGDDPRPGEYGTFLVLRDDPTDDGTEPLDPALEQWNSPDLVVVRPNGDRGSVAAVLENDVVEVTVHNRGAADAVWAAVQAFVCVPTLGWTPALAYALGTEYVTVTSYDHATVSFPFVPPAWLAGHNCLMARVSLLAPLDSYVDATVFDVRGDRHVAQRNLHVLEFADAVEGGSMQFRFLVVNPGRTRRKFELRVTERRLDRRTRKRLGALHLPAVASARRPMKVDVSVHRPARPWSPRGGDGMPRLGLVRRRDDPGEPVGRQFALAPGEQLVGAATLRRSSAKGLHLVEIAQVPVGRRTPTGGLTLAVVR